MIDVKDKILKLLRLARGREDEPEGETAKRMAEEMMEEHGVKVDEAELDEDQGPDVGEVWIVQADEPIAWMEMLLVSLCDIIYGGVVMPMIGPAGWRLYVVAEHETVDHAALTEHFVFLKNQIEQLAGDFESLLISEGKYDVKKVNSFALGLNYGITEILFDEILGYVPPQEHMPFASGKALAASSDPEPELEPEACNDLQQYLDGPLSDSFQRQVDANNEIFRQTAPPADPPTSEDVKEIQPDWRYFEQGRRTAHDQVDEVFPAEEQAQASR